MIGPCFFVTDAFLFFGVKAIGLPMERIFVDVLGGFFIVMFVTNHMIVKGALPDWYPDLFGNIPFHLPNRSDYRCLARRGGYQPPAIV